MVSTLIVTTGQQMMKWKEWVSSKQSSLGRIRTGTIACTQAGAASCQNRRRSKGGKVQNNCNHLNHKLKNCWWLRPRRRQGGVLKDKRGIHSLSLPSCHHQCSALRGETVDRSSKSKALNPCCMIWNAGFWRRQLSIHWWWLWATVMLLLISYTTWDLPKLTVEYWCS